MQKVLIPLNRVIVIEYSTISHSKEVIKVLIPLNRVIVIECNELVMKISTSDLLF